MSTPVDPKRTNVQAILVPDLWKQHCEYAEPGQCGPSEGGTLFFACPGCGQVGGIRACHPKPDHPPSWDIVEGNLAAPETLTLHPSINCVGCCGWHGYLKKGVFESC